MRGLTSRWATDAPNHISPAFDYHALMARDAALAIETSSAAGSIAIGRGTTVLGVRRFTQLRAHAAEFLPSIDALCRGHNIAPEELAHVYVSAGPGSFTGLRIGITAARTLALAIGSRIVAIPTLEVIAQNALAAVDPPPCACVVLDAKRARVYTASFALTGQEGGHSYISLDSPSEADPVVYLAAQPRNCAVLGEGVFYHQAAISASGLVVLPKDLFPPRVETVYRLGAERAEQGLFVPARDLIPVYIRPPEAEEVWSAKQNLKSKPRL